MPGRALGTDAHRGVPERAVHAVFIAPSLPLQGDQAVDTLYTQCAPEVVPCTARLYKVVPYIPGPEVVPYIPCRGEHVPFCFGDEHVPFRDTLGHARAATAAGV